MSRYETWKDPKSVEPFEATLKVTGMWRGRSAARFSVKDVDTDKEYTFTMSGFYEACLRGVKKGGLLSGRWGFRKQGGNWGLWPLEAE